MTRVATDGPLDHSLHHVYSVATIFTQNPDTPHLLVVPFDAGRMDARRNAGGWRPLTFDHKRIGNTQHTYSALTPLGNRQHIAAPGSRHWMPQLLPRVYDYQPQPGTQRVNAGLIGSLPLLFALAAFSAPPSQLTGVLETCIRPGVWQAHQFQYPAGRKLRSYPKGGSKANDFQILQNEAWS